jgi:hypothetical protein
MRLADATLTTARLHPALRCVCGHALNGDDFDVAEAHIRLVCGRCHQELIEIVVSIIDDQGGRHIL